MPFPLIDGVSFEADLERALSVLPSNLPPEITGAIHRLYQRIDVVATQLYDDVQRIKHVLLNSHHEAAASAAGLVDRDPAQAPRTPVSGVSTSTKTASQS